MDNLVLLHSQSEGRSRVYDLQLVSKEQAVEVMRRRHQQSKTWFCLFSMILIGSILQAEGGPAQVHPSLPATAICRQVLELDRNFKQRLASIILIKKGLRTQPASSLFSLLGCFPAKRLGGRSNRCFPGYCCCGCSHFLYVFFINILVTDHYAKLQQKENSAN